MIPGLGAALGGNDFGASGLFEEPGRVLGVASQGLQGLEKIDRRFGFEEEAFSPGGMFEAEHGRVEHRTRRFVNGPFGVAVIPDVHIFADQGMARFGEVNSDLMLATRLQLAHHKRRALERLDRQHMGDRPLRRRRCFAVAVVGLVGSPKPIAPVREQPGVVATDLRVAMHDRQVETVEVPIPELALEKTLCGDGSGKGQQAAGALVEAMHHTDFGIVALAVAGALAPERQAKQVDQGVPIVVVVADREHARGLVDDEHLPVGVKDRLVGKQRGLLASGSGKDLNGLRIDAQRRVFVDLSGDVNAPRSDERAGFAPAEVELLSDDRSEGRLFGAIGHGREYGSPNASAPPGTGARDTLGPPSRLFWHSPTSTSGINAAVSLFARVFFLSLTLFLVGQAAVGVFAQEDQPAETEATEAPEGAEPAATEVEPAGDAAAETEAAAAPATEVEATGAPAAEVEAAAAPAAEVEAVEMPAAPDAEAAPAEVDASDSATAQTEAEGISLTALREQGGSTPWWQRLMSIVGLLGILGIAWLMSSHKKKVPWKTVGWGVAIQMLFALFVLKTSIGKALFSWLNGAVTTLLAFTNEGSRFIFGDYLDMKFSFALNVLPTILFFSSLMAVAYHLGLMQRVVSVLAWAMQKTMGTSGSETLSATANIFVGQTEAPLVVKPYIDTMTLSEINAVMVGGFATVAGGVLAAYVGMLQDTFPDIAGHLIAASVMSAPAALVIAKILVPETEESKTASGAKLEVEKIDANIVDAAARGAGEGLQLALNVGAMLLAFLALVALADFLVGLPVELINSLFETSYEPWSLKMILGYVFWPLAFFMGVPIEDCTQIASLLGEKMVLNEFVAYTHLGEMLSGPEALHYRSVVIATYALCGFANFGSVAIQIGGISAIAPDRRSDLARLGLRAMFGGTLAACMTATVAGFLL